MTEDNRSVLNISHKRPRSTVCVSRDADRDEPYTSRKRPRSSGLLDLSDEILVRIFDFLSVWQLTQCQEVCRRFYHLAGDDQLWRMAYRRTFVLPKFQIRGKVIPLSPDASSTQPVMAPTEEIKWQRKYKISHNWSRGDCRVLQIPVTEQTSTIQPLVQLFNGIVISASQPKGICIRHIHNDSTSVDVQQPDILFNGTTHECPVAISVSGIGDSDTMCCISVSSAGGLFAVLVYSITERTFETEAVSRVMDQQDVVAHSLTYPYVAILSTQSVVKIYKIQFDDASTKTTSRKMALKVLGTVESSSAWQPMNLSTRLNRQLIICIAYAIPQNLSKWTVQLQEIQINISTGAIQIRVATERGRQEPTGLAQRVYDRGYSHTISMPLKLAYSHPYLLVASTDGTLTLSVIKSTCKELIVETRRQLWGLTSRISAMHVGPGGKAVTVGSNVQDIRVWDLEAWVVYSGQSSHYQKSVELRPWPRSSAQRLGIKDFIIQTRGVNVEQNLQDTWVGFDEERLLLLQSATTFSSMLMVYDFS